MRKRTLCFILTVAATVPVYAVSTQAPRDFSGHWVLVDAKTGEGAEATPSSQVDIRGGAVNCVKECTLVQKDGTLTISRPPDQNGTAPRDVVLSLDGHQSSFNALVKWDGPKLVVTRSILTTSVTQTISLESGQLVIVTAFNSGDLKPAKFRYEKKP
jgi:hypothetical protein